MFCPLFGWIQFEIICGERGSKAFEITLFVPDPKQVVQAVRGTIDALITNWVFLGGSGLEARSSDPKFM